MMKSCLVIFSAALLWKTNGFLIETSTPKGPHRLMGYSAGMRTSRIRSNIQLNEKLWKRLEIEEDPEPFWYLINCVAGLEMDLLNQCREVCADMEDAHKFVVPTEIKTRSHGANKMVTEAKVKYQGYVFAKLRLCPEVYEAIQTLDLCRSWMGTVNHKGHRKLPPAPVALNEMEVENFGLEDLEFEDQDQSQQANKNEISEQGNETLIVDEFDEEENEEDAFLQSHQDEALKQYLGLKVEDMVKVTARCKFYDEDGIVRRLKDGKIMVRFYTYGTMFDEWMNPGDVRKLSNVEILKGLSGPSQPVTQRDIENNNFDGYDPRSRQQNRGGSNPRNDWNVRGGNYNSGNRNRRQDRVHRGDRYGAEDESQRNEKNWKWYQENQKQQQQGRREVSDDEWTYKPGSTRDDADWALGDADSQWGRNNNNNNNRFMSKRQERRNKDQQQRNQPRDNNAIDDDWSAFVSPVSNSKTSGENSASKKSDVSDDDFFASLMTDLSKDLKTNNDDGAGRDKQTNDNGDLAFSTSTSQEDDFFASLMNELDIDQGKKENVKSARSNRKESGNNNKKDTGDSNDDEDFFASLAADISDTVEDSNSEAVSSASNFDLGDEDFFNSLVEDIGNELSKDNEEDSKSTIKGAKEDSEDIDDFFSSLEAEVASTLADETPSIQEDTTAPKRKESSSSKNPKDPVRIAESASEASTSSMNAQDLGKLTVPKLKDMLRERGLKVSGKKAELIERLSQ